MRDSTCFWASACRGSAREGGNGPRAGSLGNEACENGSGLMSVRWEPSRSEPWNFRRKTRLMTHSASGRTTKLIRGTKAQAASQKTRREGKAVSTSAGFQLFGTGGGPGQVRRIRSAAYRPTVFCVPAIASSMSENRPSHRWPKRRQALSEA